MSFFSCSFNMSNSNLFSLKHQQKHSLSVSRSHTLRVLGRKIARSIHSYTLSYRWLYNYDRAIGTEEPWDLEAKIMYINHVFVCAHLSNDYNVVCVCISCVCEHERSRKQDLCALTVSNHCQSVNWQMLVSGLGVCEKCSLLHVLNRRAGHTS